MTRYERERRERFLRQVDETRRRGMRGKTIGQRVALMVCRVVAWSVLREIAAEDAAKPREGIR